MVAGRKIIFAAQFVLTGQANFDFNQRSIFTECCFWPLKRFKWSKNFSSGFHHQINYKVSHPPPVKGNPPNHIWKTLVREMQGQALSHGSNAIHTT